jgi:hypothetical protein
MIASTLMVMDSSLLMKSSRCKTSSSPTHVAGGDPAGDHRIPVEAKGHEADRRPGGLAQAAPELINGSISIA